VNTRLPDDVGRRLGVLTMIGGIATAALVVPIWPDVSRYLGYALSYAAFIGIGLVVMVSVGRWLWPEECDDHARHCSLHRAAHVRLVARTARSWADHRQRCRICEDEPLHPEPDAWTA
jgi:hypothetical protein